MIKTIYIIILIYFLLGGIGFYFINRKKNPVTARKSWIKFITYFFIINALFFSIVFNSPVFHIISIIIVLIGFTELFKLFRNSGYEGKYFFSSFMAVFVILCIGFIIFSRMDKNVVLFTVIMLSVFDGFSQISGQLLGRKKMFPSISPSKTVEGFIGGAVMTLLNGFFLRSLIDKGIFEVLILTTGIMIFAFLGDTATSYYKRNYKVKDFSNLIPGHGGVLDRFDSLIAGGAFVALVQLVIVI